MVADWVLIEAAKRGGHECVDIRILTNDYNWGSTYRALCDMIAKHEQRPVDPDVRLVADIVNAFFETAAWPVGDCAMEKHWSDELTRAVAVYKASKA